MYVTHYTHTILRTLLQSVAITSNPTIYFDISLNLFYTWKCQNTIASASDSLTFPVTPIAASGEGSRTIGGGSTFQSTWNFEESTPGRRGIPQLGDEVSSTSGISCHKTTVPSKLA